MRSEPPADALAIATPPGVTASVLIVDDNPANLRALRAILEPLAIRVVEAGSGAEALARVLAEDFAVILMDVRMPELSGLETAALIKQRRRSRDIPIVFLSAIDRDASYVARGYRHGAVDYLIKPYEPEILRSKVTVFVDLYLKGERIKWQAALLHERERAALLLAGEQEARRQAEAASRLKDEFLAVVSHELRTPLTAILGWAQLLRAGARGAVDQARALEAIERNAAVQARLVGDLLDVSRIITGKLNLEACPIDLPAVVLAAVEAVRPAAQAKDIALDVAVDGSLGGFEGDAARLQQVCGNLLTNAVKFTPRSGHVAVRLAERDGAAELAVSDTGQGIPASFLPHVFERFRQADTTSTRAHGGLGLGLALVRTLVELHGGTVRAASPGEGKGAVFTVTLPRRGASRACCLPATVAPAVPVLHGVRVLVVDDEPDARELIAAALESRGAEVHVAASVLDALDALEEAQPHVLLSDLGMPHEDGYSLIRRVRSLDPDRGGAIPAAALTAYAGPEISQRTRAAGFQVHLAKPVEPSRIAAVVADLAQRRRVA